MQPYALPFWNGLYTVGRLIFAHLLTCRGTAGRVSVGAGTTTLCRFGGACGFLDEFGQSAVVGAPYGRHFVVVYINLTVLTHELTPSPDTHFHEITVQSSTGSRPEAVGNAIFVFHIFFLLASSIFFFFFFQFWFFFFFYVIFQAKRFLLFIQKKKEMCSYVYVCVCGLRF